MDIHVQDTGRGIPAEMVQKIFDPFVQAERKKNESSQQGVGLGLAISRDLAHAMRGDLSVKSTPGHGSTFTLTLPAGTCGEGEVELPSRAERRSQENRRSAAAEP